MTRTSYFIEIVRQLYEADGWVRLFSFHETLKLSPMQVAEVMIELTGNALATISDDGSRARLAPLGYKWIEENASNIFLQPRAAKGWRAPPQTAPDDSYIPSPKNLEIEFLTELGRGVLSRD